MAADSKMIHTLLQGEIQEKAMALQAVRVNDVSSLHVNYNAYIKLICLSLVRRLSYSACSILVQSLSSFIYHAACHCHFYRNSINF